MAMMLANDVDSRLKFKRNFKNKLYPFRCKIIHHGETYSWEKYGEEKEILIGYVAWSIRGLLLRLEEIVKYGKKSSALREYFERLNLKNN